MRVCFSALPLIFLFLFEAGANAELDSLAGQMQAMKTGVPPKKKPKKKVEKVEETTDEESDSEEEADDTSDTDTDTDTDDE